MKKVIFILALSAIIYSCSKDSSSSNSCDLNYDYFKGKSFRLTNERYDTNGVMKYTIPVSVLNDSNLKIYSFNDQTLTGLKRVKYIPNNGASTYEYTEKFDYELYSSTKDLVIITPGATGGSKVTTGYRIESYNCNSFVLYFKTNFGSTIEEYHWTYTKQ